MTNSLETYLLLAKSARGVACVQLIQDVLNAPGIYHFAELMDMPTISELQNNPQLLIHLELLKVFSYGTYSDYKSNPAFPPLTPAQLKKLRLLSIVTMAGVSKTLMYDKLLEELDIGNVRELEDLIIDGVYREVFSGKLDQKKKCLQVESALGRDLQPGETSKILASLSSWAKSTEDILQFIDQRVEYVGREWAQHARESEEYDKAVEAAKKEIKANPPNRGGSASEFDLGGGPGGIGGYGMFDEDRRFMMGGKRSMKADSRRNR